MKLYDISREILGSPLYPGTQKPRLTREKDMCAGDGYTLSTLQLDLHTATHIDTPLHFVSGGADAAEVPLAPYIGACRVLTVRGCVTETDLRAQCQPLPKRLLLRGGYLSPCAAMYLAQSGVLLVGTDNLSVAAAENEAAVHTALLRAGVAVLESLALSGVAEGDYTLIALPLKLAGAEASPCRAVLVAENENKA